MLPTIRNSEASNLGLSVDPILVADDDEYSPYPEILPRLYDTDDDDLEEIPEYQTRNSDRDSNSAYYVTGSNMFGMLGLNLPVNESSKVTSFTKLESPIISPHNIKLISCGHYHSIAITNTMEIYGCGKNNYGQLGFGHTAKCIPVFKTMETSPQNTLPKNLITDVKCGRYHTMFITDQPSDNVWVCGKNKSGQMSLINQSIYVHPTRLSGVYTGKVEFASCGSEFTFIKTTTGVFSCGDNTRGQCGIGSDVQNIRTFKPIRLTNENVVAIECGEFHTLILTSSGKLYGCGTSVNGQLGIDPTDFNGTSNFASPTLVTNLPHNEKIKSVKCGFHHSALITYSGKVYVCGRNGDGQLSRGESVQRLFKFTHVEISSSKLCTYFIQDLYCYSYYTIVVTNKKEMFLSGSNKCGQLGGEGTKIDKFTKTFKRPVERVFCGRDTLMIEAQERDFDEISFVDSYGKLLEFEDPHLTDVFDSEIICADGRKYPIMYDFVSIRFPLFEKYVGKGLKYEVEPPNKKRKPSSGTEDRTIDLSSTKISSKSVLQILKYIYTDVFPEESSELHDIKSDLEVLFWVSEASGLDLNTISDTYNKHSNTLRMVKLMLLNILKSITKDTVVDISSALQQYNSHLLIEPLYKHCIAFIKASNSTNTFKEIKDWEKLEKDILLEMLGSGDKYQLMATTDIFIPASTFAQDMFLLFDYTQNPSKNMGDITLVLNKEGTKTIRAHRPILSIKCDFFKIKFSSGMGDMNSDRIEIFDSKFHLLRNSNRHKNSC